MPNYEREEKTDLLYRTPKHTFGPSHIISDELSETLKPLIDLANGVMSKELILTWLKYEIGYKENIAKSGRPQDLEDVKILKAINFVLRNRTEENWGPKDLTMDVAIRIES